MATPIVSGIAALVKAVYPGYTVAQVKNAILNGVEKKSSLSGKCVTGGRVNARSSLWIPNPGYMRWGQFGDIPLISDWDGNGTSGIGVFRPSTGRWYFDNIRDGKTDKCIAFGRSGDTPAVGDWNKNGKTDIGIFRNSNGRWYFDNNLDGTTDKSIKFGESWDTPLVGDWDNNGKTDIGLFRSSNGRWYFRS